MKIVKRSACGFTLIELMIAVAIIGILTSISVPNYLSYRQRADYAALQATLRFFMDAEDMYMIDNNVFYPPNGTIRIRRGVGVSIPQLKFSFPAGHKHEFRIYGMNRQSGRYFYNDYYIYVYADADFNQNGQKDRFYYRTRFRNNELLYNRKLFQVR